MRSQSFEFSPTAEVVSLGIRGVCFVVCGLSNRESDAEFDAISNERLSRVAAGPFDPDGDPILLGFRRLHDAVGAHPKKDIASPQTLLKMVHRSGKLPRINLLVDIYNLVSVETKLSLGAHDLARVHGNVSVRLANGSERFVPLGGTDPVPVRNGEYAYIDDANDVLCRLEVRQADKSKLSVDTREAMVMIQGNSATDSACLQQAYESLTKLIRQFCGGEIREVWRST